MCCLLSWCASPNSESPSAIPFDFHSDFWLNLHLDLYRQAKPDRTQKIATPPNPDWDTALAYYKTNLVSHDLTFDSAMIDIKNALEDQQDSQSLVPTQPLSPPLIAVLQNAAPFYRKDLWPKQDEVNRHWIEHVKPLVERYGFQLAHELAQAYQTAWPSNPIRVDVTTYANWAGAFTTIRPKTRITISSIDSRNQNNAALEILFHEASHGIVHRLRDAIVDECKKQNVQLPRDLWHAVLFYTAGEMVRRAIPGYVPYAEANGLWKGAWPMYFDALNRDWKPYLEGNVSFADAVSALVKDVGQPKPNTSA